MTRHSPLLAILVAAVFSTLLPGGDAHAEPPSAEPPSVEHIDRVVVRWHARATGGAMEPKFITARELAFEARLEALTEKYRDDTQPFNEKHVRVALQRHITEEILGYLPVSPVPTPKMVGRYAEAVRLRIEEQIGGRQVLNDAASAEGLDSSELDALLRRRARAGWYLDKMVAPMLQPTDFDLREILLRERTQFSGQRFDDVEDALRSWYISTRLARAVDRYYRNIRTRVEVTLIDYEGW